MRPPAEEFNFPAAPAGHTRFSYAVKASRVQRTHKGVGPVTSDTVLATFKDKFPGCLGDETLDPMNIQVSEDGATYFYHTFTPVREVDDTPVTLGDMETGETRESTLQEFMRDFRAYVEKHH